MVAKRRGLQAASSLATLACVGLLAIACGEAPTVEPSRHGAADPLLRSHFVASERASLRHATNFSIDYEGSTKRITIHRPWRGADFALSYLLLAGADVPLDSDRHDAVFCVPVRRVVTTSSTHLPHIEALGLEDRLVGHDRFDYVTATGIRSRIEAGLVTEVGDGVRLNPEVLLDVRPDLVIAFSIGSPQLDIFGTLTDAGVPFAVDGAWVEDTPLARAEWIKFTAAFFNREDEANALFDEIADRYEELTRLVAGVEHRPTVLVGAPFRGTWHVSGGGSYQAQFIRDAGGDYLWSDDESPGSLALDLEAVYGRALDAEVWIHPSDWRSLADALRSDPRMADFKAFQRHQVFNNDRRMNEHGGNDYWESGSLRPDLVLADLIRILHPELLSDHEPVYHRRLPRES